MRGSATRIVLIAASILVLILMIAATHHPRTQVCLPLLLVFKIGSICGRLSFRIAHTSLRPRWIVLLVGLFPVMQSIQVPEGLSQDAFCAGGDAARGKGDREDPQQGA